LIRDLDFTMVIRRIILMYPDSSARRQTPRRRVRRVPKLSLGTAGEKEEKDVQVRVCVRGRKRQRVV